MIIDITDGLFPLRILYEYSLSMSILIIVELARIQHETYAMSILYHGYTKYMRVIITF